MVMNDSEIISSYKQAKCKNQQVQVLADLNAVSREEMADYLESLGLELPKRAGKSSDKPEKGQRLEALAGLLSKLGKQYPGARVLSNSGEITAVTVISRLALDGSEIWTEIRLQSGGKSGG